MATAPLSLTLEPLTRSAFAPFGDLLACEGAADFNINAGRMQRFHGLATADVDVATGGRVVLSMVRCQQATTAPIRVTLVERHPRGSQAFMPLCRTPLVLVVAGPGDVVAAEDLRAFLSNGHQGINYHRGIWHMPLVSLRAGQELLVVDRDGPGENCDEQRFARDILVPVPPDLW